jgi:hypothetical protein
MSFLAWLRSGKRRGSAPKRPAVRPRLEALEDRCVPSTLNHHCPPPPTPSGAVTNLLDSGPGSLRYEIAAAKSGDTITFAPGLDGQTITLSSGNELYIAGKNLTIQGPGTGLLTVASGPSANTSRIFEVAAATVTLIGLTISNGGGRAHLYANGSPGDGNGGAVLNDPDGGLTISGCTLTGNSADYGGAIYNQGTLTVSGCTLSNNSTSRGGSGGGIYNTNALTVSGCTLSGNTAYDGGGIYNASTGWLSVSGGALSGNSAAFQGGGIFNDGLTTGAVTVSGCTLSKNSAAWGGGGIFNNGLLTVLDSIFSSNSPDNIFGPYTDGGGNTFK